MAKVCSDYLQYCERGVVNSTISKGHRDNATTWLNDLCSYCGALPVAGLKKGHVKTWMEKHPTWRSTATHRSVLSIVLAAFNHAEEMYSIPSPLKGLKKPASQPRLQSLSREDEEAIYGATEERFRDFLFAAIHTGLRPFCELAQVTADHVEETERGMMWRVYSSKTKKTRKIPVRPEVAGLTRRLMETAPTGSGIPLFRNTQGNPWKKVTGVGRFEVGQIAFLPTRGQGDKPDDWDDVTFVDREERPFRPERGRQTIRRENVDAHSLDLDCLGFGRY